MGGRVAYRNGALVAERDLRLSLYDSALLYGDLAYEVTRTIHGRPYRLAEHLERLSGTLAALRITLPCSLTELERDTLRVLTLNQPTEAPDVDWQIMHSVSRGPSSAFADAFGPDEPTGPVVMICCYPLVERLARLAAAYDHGIDLIVPPQRSLPHELVDTSIKTRSRLHFQLANLQAEERLPGSTALLLDPAGHLTEGTSGNVFLVHNSKLRTPTTRNILPGVTRRAILDLAARLRIPTEECDLSQAEALAADEIFMTSTSIGVLHARTLDQRTIGSGAIGPITLRLRTAFFADVGLDFAAQARQYAGR